MWALVSAVDILLGCRLVESFINVDPCNISVTHRNVFFWSTDIKIMRVVIVDKENTINVDAKTFLRRRKNYRKSLQIVLVCIEFFLNILGIPYCTFFCQRNCLDIQVLGHFFLLPSPINWSLGHVPINSCIHKTQL